MKRILVLLVVLFSIGFSKDLTELGYEAYVKGDYQKAAQLYQKACDSGVAGGCNSLGSLYGEGKEHLMLINFLIAFFIQPSVNNTS